MQHNLFQFDPGRDYDGDKIRDLIRTQFCCSDIPMFELFQKLQALEDRAEIEYIERCQTAILQLLIGQLRRKEDREVVARMCLKTGKLLEEHGYATSILYFQVSLAIAGSAFDLHDKSMQQYVCAVESCKYLDRKLGLAER